MWIWIKGISGYNYDAEVLWAFYDTCKKLSDSNIRAGLMKILRLVLVIYSYGSLSV